MADLWLKANYPLGPFSVPPVDQAVADVLANSPYAAWRTGRVAFTYEFVDRPEAGTALLSIVNPPTRQTPSDGLRYMYAEPNEVRSTSQHTVSVPSSSANPGQSRKEEVILECYTAMAGHFPPISPSQPLTPDSPEMRLTRYRKRWRISNGQYPGLWFYYWGRDDSGGLGGTPAPTAPAGWDRTPARTYPLVRPTNFPTAPLFPFPDQSRPPAGQSGSMPPPATPQQQPPPNAGTPNAANPYAARQQQLAALAAAHTPLGMSTSNPALEARQQQFQAQQAAMMAAQQQQQARAAGGMPGGYSQYGMTPQQMQLHAHQAQMLAQQQQQQQQQAAAAHAAQAAAQAATAQAAAASAARNQRKPPSSAVPTSAQAVPPPNAAASSGPNVAAAVPPQHEDETPLTDIFDHLTPRQLATHRYAKQHDLLAPLFDAWSTTSIAEGAMRVREVDELVKTNGISARLGEPRQGVVPGLGREGALGLLGTSAARVAVYGALGKKPEKATMGMDLDDRRERLEKMLRELEGQCEDLEGKNEQQLEKVRRATSGAGAIEVAA